MESYWINKWTITKFHAVQDFFKFKITLITVLKDEITKMLNDCKDYH